MSVAVVGRKDEIHYLESCHSESPFDDVELQSVDGKKFRANRLLLISCSNFIRLLLEQLENRGILHDQVSIYTNLSSFCLEQIVLFVSFGILTSHFSLQSLLEDENLSDSFQTFGIDLSKVKLTTSSTEPKTPYHTLIANVEPTIFVKEEVLNFDDDLQFDDADSEEDISTKSEAGNDFPDPDLEEDPIEEKTDRRRRKKVTVEKKTNEPKRKRKSSVKKPKESKSDCSEDNDTDDPDFDLVKRPKKKESKNKIKNEKVEPRRRLSKSLFRFTTEGERDSSKKFQCPNCIKGYSNNRDFQLHLLRHEPDAKGWKCQRCKDVAFKIREELKKHVEDVHMNDVYFCSYCPKTFKGTSFGHYNRHLDIHEKQIQSQAAFCIACGLKTKTPKQLSVHLAMMGPFHDGHCATCDHKVNSWREHQAHILEAHDGKAEYRCGKCQIVFPTKGDVRSHRLQAHGKQVAAAVCEECGQTTKSLRVHILKFHGTEEHPCPHCPKIFKHATVLKAHNDKAHLNLQCHHCGKVLRNKAKLKVHMDSQHTPAHLKPYQCSICPDKGFATLSNLREHNNIHTNERPHKCKFCAVGFNSKANMFNHQKKCKEKHEQQSDSESQ